MDRRRGGLLGQHVERALAAFGQPYLPATAIVRGRSRRRRPAGRAAGDELARRAAGGPWRIVWCAGAGVVGTAESSLVDELARFDRCPRPPGWPGRRRSAGQPTAPCSSRRPRAACTPAPPTRHSTSGPSPRPIAPYGHAKLAQELAAERWSARTGVPVVIGRIGNLYGPGQDLRKAQGLISELGWTQIRQQPLTIYVPLATMRDYVYVVDCAAAVAGAVGIAATRRDRQGDRLAAADEHRARARGVPTGPAPQPADLGAGIPARSPPSGRSPAAVGRRPPARPRHQHPVRRRAAR